MPYVNEGVRVKPVETCFLCGKEGIKLYSDMQDHLLGAPGVWSLFRCPECGLVWLNPRPISEDISNLYKHYTTHVRPDVVAREGVKSGVKTLIKSNILASVLGYKSEVANRTIGSVLSRIGPLREIVASTVMWLKENPGGQLLDVGCGNGEFLFQMQELGWKGVGVEPDAEAAVIARDHLNLDVRTSTLKDASFQKNSFDAITMNHVLEHDSNPIATLKKCRIVLKPNGQIIITTPNSQSFGALLFRRAWRGWEVPRHLQVFSKASLENVVEQAGFNIMESRTTCRSAYWIWTQSRLSGDSCSQTLGFRTHPVLKFEGGVFQLVEHFFSRRNVGEELLIRAKIGGRCIDE